MAYLLPHLKHAYAVDQAIVHDQERVVVIRFGHDENSTCMVVDEALYSISEDVKLFAVIYVVDITLVPEFNEMYELEDECSVMFSFVISILWSTVELATTTKIIGLCKIDKSG